MWSGGSPVTDWIFGVRVKMARFRFGEYGDSTKTLEDFVALYMVHYSDYTSGEVITFVCYLCIVI